MKPFSSVSRRLVAVGAVFLFFVVAPAPAKAAGKPAPARSPAAQAMADADKLALTPAGIEYQQSCSKAAIKLYKKAQKECGRSVSQTTLVDVVLMIGADGRVLQALPVTNDTVSTCVADHYSKLVAPKPPSANWPLHLQVEIAPN